MGEPDVSVVVVHGTGTQAPGHTVEEWVDSLLGFTDAAGRRAAPVHVSELPRQGAEPVAATVAVGGPGSADAVVVDDPVVRLRLVEAYWAEAFAPPTPGDVLRWLLWFAPSFAVTQAVLEIRALRQERRRAVPEPAQRRVHLLRPVAPLYAIALGLVGLALLGPALVLAALVLVVGSAVPSERVRTAVAVVLGFLSQNVGDVHSFLIRPVARARMESRIAEVVTAEVRAHGRDKVHVLATSQGAALLHAVLLRLPRHLRPARMTTVGGAHGRLHEIRVLRPPVWTRTPIVLTGLTWLLALPLVGALGVLGGTAVVLGVTAVAAVLLGAATHDRLRSFTARTGTELPSPGVVPGVQWLDVWAPFDAVPNARPVAPPGGGYRYVVVPGEMRVLADHLAYATDWTESVPRILHHVTGHLPERARLGAARGVRARSALQDPEGAGSNWMPWAGRDWVALALRALPVVAVLVALLTPARRSYRGVGEWVAGLHPVADRVLAALEGLLDGALALFGPTPLRAAGWPESAVGVVVALVLALALGWVSTALFRVAARTEARRWARSLDAPPVERWTVGRWTVVGAGIVAVWAALGAGAVALVAAATY